MTFSGNFSGLGGLGSTSMKIAALRSQSWRASSVEATVAPEIAAGVGER